ncbi:MAG TPA: DmsE family decaheme c-type cytochrome [Bryobacteraceae bacterium]|nr:DmsE family decaheme c-type cytochrome [Bryobacteraceae bacterium]
MTLHRLPYPFSNRSLPVALLLTLLAVAVPATFAQGAPQSQAAPSTGAAQEKPGAPAPSQVPANKPAEYVGSTTCQGCHEDIYNAFQKNPHDVVDTSTRWKMKDNACESCHGPGSKHAESMNAADIIQPAKLKPPESENVCLKCHLNTPTNVGRINGSHARNEVPCVSCHTIHRRGPFGVVARRQTEVNALCARCHNDVWASFQQPFRHPLPQGAMSCVDCHNPHGTFLPKMIQTVFANEPGCFKCHSDLRGPFVFEHPPVQTEGCVACHQPHGSTNPRMLTRAQVRFVCLECHANLPLATGSGTLGTVPPALHDLRSPRFQNCNICHQKIHGSYVNRDFFK